MGTQALARAEAAGESWKFFRGGSCAEQAQVNESDALGGKWEGEIEEGEVGEDEMWWPLWRLR